MAATIRPKVRRDIAAITCPLQRAVASRMQEIQDVFCAGFARLRAESRLVAQPGISAVAAHKWRNMMRMPAIGFAVRLGLEIGLTTHSLHGRKYGYTQIAELKDLHYVTTQNACALFDAIIRDKGEVGTAVAARYAQVLKAVHAEVSHIEPMTRTRRTAA